MSLPVETTFATPDPNLCPSTFTETVAALNELVSSTMTGTYTPYIVGSSTPAVEDQDKIWHKLDSLGRPIGTYRYYSGTWIRMRTGLPTEVVFFWGDPTPHFDNATSKGLITSEWYGWALCTGAAGTPNLSNHFLVNADLENIGTRYVDGAWRTDVSGASTQLGGLKETTLTEEQTPRPARAAVTVAKWKADGNTPDAGSGLHGQNPTGGNTTTLLAADAGNLDPTPVPTLPPYIAIAPVMWIGYD